MTDTTDIKALREKYELALKDLTERLTECNRLNYCMDEITAFAAFSSTLIDKLEAERQRADDAHKYGSERDSENESLMLTVGRLRVEIAELKGDQKPYGYYSAETETILEQQGHASISAEPLADSRFPLFTAPQKPVVTLPALPTTPIVPTQPFSLHDIMRATRNMDIKAIEAAGCIVKDGE